MNEFRIPGECDKSEAELVELTQRFNWKSREKDFAPDYLIGTPGSTCSKDGRLHALSRIRSSDETFVDRMIENPYGSTFVNMKRNTVI